MRRKINNESDYPEKNPLDRSPALSNQVIPWLHLGSTGTPDGAKGENGLLFEDGTEK